MLFSIFLTFYLDMCTPRKMSTKTYWSTSLYPINVETDLNNHQTTGFL
jgi:hypothetical protein